MKPKYRTMCLWQQFDNRMIWIADRIIKNTTGFKAILKLGILLFIIFQFRSLQSQEMLKVETGRMTEISLVSNKTYANPFFDVKVYALFSGPHDQLYLVEGFWDGEQNWKIRFCPPAQGEYTFKTYSSDPENEELNGEKGTIQAIPYQGSNLLYLNGGILKLSLDCTHLTYTNGKPFFWLGESWTFATPSEMPFDKSDFLPSHCPHPDPKKADSVFKTCVDDRALKGYNVVLMGWMGNDVNQYAVKNPKLWKEKKTIDFFKKMDRSIQYGNDQGIIFSLGIGFHSELNDIPIEDLEKMWAYVVARYGAYCTTWWVSGEYNANYSRYGAPGHEDVSTKESSIKEEKRAKKLLQLCQFLKDIDPYRRASSINPIGLMGDDRRSWDKNLISIDFAMLQGFGWGKMAMIPVRFFYDAYRSGKPVIDVDGTFEDLQEGIFKRTTDTVRLAAYRSLQSGSSGYGNSVHGLWYPAHNLLGQEQWVKLGYGKSKLWWEALELPAASQLGKMKSFYERFEWWRLVPLLGSIEAATQRPERYLYEPNRGSLLDSTYFSKNEEEDKLLGVATINGANNHLVLVKAIPDYLYLVYFPSGLNKSESVKLKELRPNMLFEIEWFNPRKGETVHSKESLKSDGNGKILLPNRPDMSDWMLVLKASLKN